MPRPHLAVIIAFAVGLAAGAGIGVVTKAHRGSGHPSASPRAVAASTAPTVSPSPSTSSTPLTETTGKVVYRSTLTRAEGWRSGSIGSHVSASFGKRGYIVTGTERLHHAILTPYLNRSPGRSVTVGIGHYALADVSMGSGCQSSATAPYYIYQFIVYPDDNWYLERADPDNKVTILDEGTGDPSATIKKVTLTCLQVSQNGTTTDTQLTGYVNGTQEAQMDTDQKGLPSAGWLPILVIGSSGHPVSVTLTSFTVRDVPVSVARTTTT